MLPPLLVAIDIRAHPFALLRISHKFHRDLLGALELKAQFKDVINPARPCSAGSTRGVPLVEVPEPSHFVVTFLKRPCFHLAPSVLDWYESPIRTGRTGLDPEQARSAASPAAVEDL